MAQPPYVCLYLDYRHTFNQYSDAERGRLLSAILEYAATGEEPNFTGNERFAWAMIQGQIQRDQKKYQERCEKNRLNGLKGGRPPKEEAHPPSEFDRYIPHHSSLIHNL